MISERIKPFIQLIHEYYIYNEKILAEHNRILINARRRFRRGLSKLPPPTELKSAKSFVPLDILRTIIPYCCGGSAYNLSVTGRVYKNEVNNYVQSTYKSNHLIKRFRKPYYSWAAAYRRWARILCHECYKKNGKHYSVFNRNLCNNCQLLPEFKLIYKTTAIRTYKVKPKQLQTLPYMEVKNVHAPTTKAYLYSLTDVLNVVGKKSS